MQRSAAIYRTISLVIKTERLDIRLTGEQKNLIETAAEIEGTTVAGFTVTAVVGKATETIERHKRIALSETEWDNFVAALDEPARTNPRLARLFYEASVLEV
jgi:uncharacterized protein (DUF1778 family)